MQKALSSKENYLIQLAILIIASLLFIPYLGSVHLFDWDEINFAESAREMLVSGDYLSVQINYIPFWEKPPLFIWMQVLSMKVFGVNEFAARFPNAIAGITSLLVFYNIGKQQFNYKFALTWVMVYAGSILPFLYFKSGIIDPWFNLFIFLGTYFFIVFSNQDTKRPLLFVFYSAVFIGLGILTKGPVALLLFGLTAFIYMIINKKYKLFLALKPVTIFVLTLSFVGGFWFILQILSGNSSVLVDFIEYQIYLFSKKGAGHGGFPLYHFVVLLIGVFPASIFALKSFKKSQDISTNQKNFKQWMIILFWVVLILFSIVNTKIVHYSSMCYFPLTFLATLIIYNILTKKDKFNTWIKILITIFSILLGGIVIALNYFVKYKDLIIDKNLIKDKFAIANLNADVYWSGYEFFIGVFLIITVLVSLYIFKNKKLQIASLFASTIIFVNLVLFIIVPRIEQYSQNAAISFYEELSTKDCYVSTYNFKSYAQYFYTKKNLPQNKKSYDFNWLTTGAIDKPVYIVCKNSHAKSFSDKYSNFKRLNEKNGFVFFYRGVK